MRLSIGGLQGFSFCAEISVRLFTVCFCCLLFLYFSKMLWRERPRLSGWNTLNNPAHFAFFSWEEEKTEYILVPALATVAILLLLLLYDSFIHGEGDLWDVSSFVFVLLRSFVRLVVCMFSFFSVSLCQSTNTDTCSCATEILWLITWSDSRSVCGRKNPLKGSFTKLWRINIHIYI